MTSLKQVIKYTNANAIEATWVDREVIPAVGVEGEECYQPEQVKETVIKTTAYSDTQMDLFRADVATYGGDIAEYEDLIAEVEAAYVPPTPHVPTQEEINAENRAYLASTDWYVVRFAETGVAIPADILSARQAARDAIV